MPNERTLTRSKPSDARPDRLAAFSPAMEGLRLEAKQYLYAHLYNAPDLAPDHDEAEQVIATLFHAWVANPELLPPSYASQIEQEGAPRVVADYIAGMTDQYIFSHYQAWTLRNRLKSAGHAGPSLFRK